ncbi:hypothetical protein D9M73_64310 [compost metagenome]
MRVVGCVPVPKAKPGSSRISCFACAGGSCQVGTIQNSGVISTGENCDCVSRTQSCSGTAWMATSVQPAKKSCACSSLQASIASASVANNDTTRERSQPALGGGMPGSPNSACSAGVSASASSTDTLSASSASSASLMVSTSSAGTSKISSNMLIPFTPGLQRTRLESHSSR